jgi:membrane protease YdiL (CAAX protease family)
MTNIQKQAAFDLTLVIVLGAVTNYLIYQIKSDLAGPVTAFLMLILVLSIFHWRKIKLASIGLRMPDRLLMLPVHILLTMIGTILVGALTHKFAGQFLPAAEAQSRFVGMEGNLTMFLKWVIIGWVVGGIAEEVIFRGFLFNRFESLAGAVKYSPVLALIFQASLFGLIHFYNRGALGAVTIFMVAMAMGGFYLLFKRNLIPLIFAHGIVDSLSFLEDYLGV